MDLLSISTSPQRPGDNFLPREATLPLKGFPVGTSHTDMWQYRRKILWFSVPRPRAWYCFMKSSDIIKEQFLTDERAERDDWSPFQLPGLSLQGWRGQATLILRFALRIWGFFDMQTNCKVTGNDQNQQNITFDSIAMIGKQLQVPNIRYHSKPKNSKARAQVRRRFSKHCKHVQIQT